jgi:predicted transcriptional regulator
MSTSDLDSMYWHSSQSINEIAEKLGISRRAIYAGITPLESGSLCATCGATMVFTNRAAREKGESVCMKDHSLSVERQNTSEDRRVGAIRLGVVYPKAAVCPCGSAGSQLRAGLLGVVLGAALAWLIRRGRHA